MEETNVLYMKEAILKCIMAIIGHFGKDKTIEVVKRLVFARGLGVEGKG